MFTKVKNLIKSKSILGKLLVFPIFSLLFFQPSFVLAYDRATVATQQAVNVTMSLAVLNGEIIRDGGCNDMDTWFKYGTHTHYNNETPHCRYRDRHFSAHIYNLSPCTTYHYKAVARNNQGISFGENRTFTTKCSAPSVDIKANNSNGPITIPYNTSANLTWTSENANYCYASGDWSGTKAINGSQTTGNLSHTKTYIITCENLSGSVSDEVRVEVNINHPPVANAGRDKEIYENESVVLEGLGTDPDGDPITYFWSCNGGSLSNPNISQPIFYAPPVSQNRNYVCSLTVRDCYNAVDSDSMNVLVKPRQPQTLFVDLITNPNSGCFPLRGVDLEASVSGTIRGNITYFFDCNNDGVWEKIATRENNVYSANFYDASNLCNYSSIGNYTARVRVERGTLVAEDTAQVNVYSCYSSPTVDIKANNSNGPITIPYNTSANLTWTSENANYCYASGDWSGTKATYGSQTTGNLSHTKIYTIICNGQGGSSSDTVRVNVLAAPVVPVAPVAPVAPSSELIITKLVRNRSDGTSWANSVSADPTEIIAFSIGMTAINSSISNLFIKDILPSRIIYLGNLKINGKDLNGDITSGLTISNLSPNKMKTITFDAHIAERNKFSSVNTQLINTVLVQAKGISKSNTANVNVTKKTAVGAATDIATGFTNNIFLDSFLLPLIISLLIIWLFRSHIFKFEEWLDLRKKRYKEYHSDKTLYAKIKRIKARE